MTAKGKILVVDDEHSVRWAFDKAFRKAGYDTALAENGLAGLELFKEYRPDLTFIDIRMPKMDGLQLLTKIKEIEPGAQIVVMTAYTDMETTITAMKLGAYDFLSKPFDINECMLLVSRAINVQKTAQSESAAEEEVDKSNSIKGKSPAMQEVYKLIGKVSLEDVTVLITGESGSGKELVAQAVHYNSARASKPFWGVNCTAINETLMESELFGYEKGAFTGAQAAKAGMFEIADGGTVFLDEIGDMSFEMQAKLLRVLEEREIVRVGGSKKIKVDVRIIAATNKDLRKLIQEKKFREDLYHRIKVIEIKLPPLRDRGEDIGLLARYFCSLFAAKRKGAPKALSDEAIDALYSYHWPGNVRELKNVVDQAYTLSRDKIIMPDDLPSEIFGSYRKVTNLEKKETNATAISSEESLYSSAALSKETIEISRNLDEQSLSEVVSSIVSFLIKQAEDGNVYASVIETFEKELLAQSLQENRHNQVKSAAQLGITRNTLRSKIAKYGL